MATTTTPIAERYHPRVEANLMVRVNTGRRDWVVRATNLSMDGLYVSGDVPLPRRVMVTIPLPSGEEVVTGCDVSRADDSGAALRFDTLDWDHLIALARFLNPRLP
ncbi:MAG: PilZ domain-containing protein [Myxococcaceae bacterium]